MFTQGSRSIRKGTIDGRLIKKACLGDNDLFAWEWLTLSTKETLITNFGQVDGPKVIEATEQYLDNLGGTKANNLVTYINNDPLIVCSLGLLIQDVNLPVRTITSGNTYAYIDTGISRTQGTYEECKACVTLMVSENFLYGSMLTYSPYNRQYIKLNNTGTVQIGHDNVYPNSSWTISVNKVYNIDGIITPTSATVHFDNNVVTSSGNRRLSSNTFKIFSTDWAKNKYPSTFVIYGHFAIYETDKTTIIADLLPCISNNKNGVYDIERNIWLGNANTSGSLTIGYKKYENGSWITWTPQS